MTAWLDDWPAPNAKTSPRFSRRCRRSSGQAPTLCERWNVRQVAAHAISFDELSRWRVGPPFLKGRLSVDRINQVGVDDYADRSPEQLVALIGSTPIRTVSQRDSAAGSR